MEFVWLVLVMSISYCVIVLVFKILYRYWWIPKKIENQFSKQGIRGPKYRFFLGNLKEVAGFMLKASSSSSSQQQIPHRSCSHNILPRVLPFYHHWHKIYGGSFLVWFGPTARLTISDPVLLREILITKSKYFEKNEAPPLVRKLEGDGLFSLEGEKWSHHRKIMTPTFYLQNLKLMIPVMAKTMGKILEQWSNKMSSSDGKAQIEVTEWFQNLAEDVITHTAFGNSYEDGKSIFKLQAQQMVYATEAYHKVFIPGYWLLPTGKNRISWRLDKEIRKSLLKLIDKRRKNYSLSGECTKKTTSYDDLLELMIKAAGFSANYCSKLPSNASMISANDIVGECKTIFFAGKHTTSNLLTWTTILLGMYPQWQELAREEVLAVCGSRDIPTIDHLAKLKTIGLILNESLRLYPPAVAIIRRAIEDIELGGVMIIPKGTEILIPILAIHHDPELWGPDVNEFNPIRFAKGMGHASKHPMAYVPFGLGSRKCIGQNLAILEAKLAIAMILQRFTFEIGPTYQHAPTVQMLLHPQYGAPIIFQKL